MARMDAKRKEQYQRQRDRQQLLPSGKVALDPIKRTSNATARIPPRTAAVPQRFNSSAAVLSHGATAQIGGSTVME